VKRLALGLVVLLAVATGALFYLRMRLPDLPPPPTDAELQALLEKRDAIAAETAAQLRVTAIVENLKRKALDAESLAAYWTKVPSTDRTRVRVATAAARLFIDRGGCRQAHEIIRGALAEQWSTDLAALYGECRGDDDLERIEQCERWLKEQPRDAGLVRSTAAPAARFTGGR